MSFRIKEAIRITGVPGPTLRNWREVLAGDFAERRYDGFGWSEIFSITIVSELVRNYRLRIGAFQVSIEALRELCEQVDEAQWRRCNVWLDLSTYTFELLPKGTWPKKLSMVGVDPVGVLERLYEPVKEEVRFRRHGKSTDKLTTESGEEHASGGEFGTYDNGDYQPLTVE